MSPMWILTCSFAITVVAAIPGNAEPVPKPEITPESMLTAEAMYRNVCATCHGEEGQGNKEVGAPSIGGLPDWYVEQQLRKFRAGHRGAAESPETAADPQAFLMRSMALALPEKMVPEIAEHIESLPKHPTKNTLGGDPEGMKIKFMELCAECHRFNAQGERVFHSAPLTLLPDWYLASQLHKFQTGVRGNEETDVEGQKMQLQASQLSGEDIRNMVAYIAELAERYPPGESDRRRRERRNEAIRALTE